MVYIYPTYLLRTGREKRSVLNWSTAGLTSDFSFSQAIYQTKAKEPGLPYYRMEQ